METRIRVGYGAFRELADFAETAARDLGRPPLMQLEIGADGSLALGVERTPEPSFEWLSLPRVDVLPPHDAAAWEQFASRLEDAGLGSEPERRPT